MGPIRRALYLALAGLFFLLGALGAILPALPATPFLLITSYFLVRTSPRLHRRLLRSRLVGPLLADWDRHRGVRTHVKWQAAAIVVIAIACTFAFADLSPTAKTIVGVLAAIGLTVIYALPSVREIEPEGPATPSQPEA